MRGLKGVRMKEQEEKMNREEDGSFDGLRAFLVLIYQAGCDKHVLPLYL